MIKRNFERLYRQLLLIPMVMDRILTFFLDRLVQVLLAMMLMKLDKFFVMFFDRK